MEYIIEIATNDFETTRAAVEGGADRIELCAALSEGGITPSMGVIKQCRERFGVQLFPIIRPRGGDFLYSGEEYQVMMHDILFCKQTGCDGVVIGMLQKDGSIDVQWTKRLVELAYPMEVTFHRAFDRCRDPYEALEQIIDAGCQRILTSGQKPTAPDGAELIAELVKKADGRIVIMPGSGVRPENVKTLAEQTGAVEFHTSLRGVMDSVMEFRHPDFADDAESYKNAMIDPARVRAMRVALMNIEQGTRNFEC